MSTVLFEKKKTPEFYVLNMIYAREHLGCSFKCPRTPGTFSERTKFSLV